MNHLRLAVVAALALAAATAQARSGYGGDMVAAYPNIAGTKLDSCITCHGDSKSLRNAYGTAYENQLLAGVSSTAAFAPINGLDSDGDGYTNGAEFAALTYPGDAADKPSPAPVTYCADADADGYAVCVTGCTLAAGDVCGDCNDKNSAIKPGAAEVCTDGVDNNCNGQVDAQEPVCAPPPPTYCVDADADGYVVCNGCTQVTGQLCGECNDATAAANPGAAEVCTDGLDNDCDGAIDAADPVCAPPPAASDYDTVAVNFAATGAYLRQTTTVSVDVYNAGTSTGNATLKLVGTSGRKSVVLADGAPLTNPPGSVETKTYNWKPNATGVWTFTATVTDTDADGDQVTATVTVNR